MSSQALLSKSSSISNDAKPSFLSFLRTVEQVDEQIIDLLIGARMQSPDLIASSVIGILREYTHNPTNNPDYLEGHHHEYDLQRVHNLLSDSFDFISSGSFSSVFGIDDKWVLKVNCVDDQYAEQDAAYSWLRGCINMQSNPFVPKLASLAQHGKLYVAVMERLVENDDIFTAPDGFCFTDLAEEHTSPDFCFINYLYDMREYPGVAHMCAIDRQAMIDLSVMYEDVRRRVGGTEDMADFNVMFRGKIPVITDPLGTATHCELVADSSFYWMSDTIKCVENFTVALIPS